MKLWVEQSTGLNMDALHVHAGVLAQLGFALLLRRSVASAWPWLLLLAVQVANEWWDLTYEIWPTRDEQWAESIRDTWNTMLLPSILMLMARFAPGLFTGRRHRPGEAERPKTRSGGAGGELVDDAASA